jgi:uracil-DNA glycosylase
MSDQTGPTPEELARQVRQRLESLRAAGVDWLPAAPPGDLSALAPASEAGGMAAAPPSLFDDRLDQPPSGAGDVGQRRQELAVLAGRVAACTRCPGLAATRTQTVFGVGPVDADICFVGEAPGADEDRLGEPFVGAAGQLLNRILAACGLKREEVYICNILRCRPPGNRPPQADEAANCREYLERQIELVRPKVLVALGGSATRHLLGTSVGITRLRGRFLEYRGVPVMCTYHPSYLLRLYEPEKTAKKKEVWEDMKKVLARVGRPVPGR